MGIYYYQPSLTHRSTQYFFFFLLIKTLKIHLCTEKVSGNLSRFNCCFCAPLFIVTKIKLEKKWNCKLR